MIQTYRIIGAALAIPNIPGTWHAGQEVDVETDTNEVLATRLLPTTPHDADNEQSAEKQDSILLDARTVSMSLAPSIKEEIVIKASRRGFTEQEKSPAPDETGEEDRS